MCVCVSLSLSLHAARAVSDCVGQTYQLMMASPGDGARAKRPASDAAPKDWTVDETVDFIGGGKICAPPLDLLGVWVGSE